MNKALLPVYVLLQVAGNNKLREVMDFKEDPNIIYVQSDKISIRNPSLAPLHIDGEPAQTSDEFRIRVLRNCFKLLRP